MLLLLLFCCLCLCGGGPCKYMILVNMKTILANTKTKPSSRACF